MTINDSAIFVVGYQHSGTTLVQNILGRNQEVYKLPFETKFFEHSHMIRKRFPTLDDDEVIGEYVRFLKEILETGYRVKGEYALGGESWVVDLDLDEGALERFARSRSGKQTHVQIYREFCDLVAKANASTRWVEGTPSHVFFADVIGQAIPDARFVEIVRDARDVLASKKTMAKTAKENPKYDRRGRQIRDLAFSFDPVLDGTSWKAAIRAGQKGQRQLTGRWHRIRYEDLVTDPWPVVEDLCAFLELSADEDMLRVSGRGGAEWSKHRDSEGIRQDSLGRWRKVLDPGEFAVAQLVVRKELSALGYEVADVGFRESLAAPLLFARSGLKVVDRIRRKLALGGPGYATNVLVNWRDRAARLFEDG